MPGRSDQLLAGWSLRAGPAVDQLSVLGPDGEPRAHAFGLGRTHRPRANQVLDLRLPDGRRATLTNGSDWRRGRHPASRGRLTLDGVTWVLEHLDSRRARLLRGGTTLATLGAGVPIPAVQLHAPLTGDDELAVAVLGLVLKPGRSGVLDALGALFGSLT